MECKHCGTSGSDNFCSNCGHPLYHKRIMLPGLLHEVVHTFTHFEKGYLLVIKQLAVTPGTMQKRYLEGYGGKSQKPFPMFVICGTLCALVLYLTNRSFNNDEQYFMRNYYVLLQTAMLPFYALTTWMLFSSSKLYYAEILVLTIYMVGFMLLIVIPINVFDFLFGKAIISYLEMVALIGYNTWTFLNFFNNKPVWWVIVKSIFNILICYTLFQIIAEFLIGVMK